MLNETAHLKVGLASLKVAPGTAKHHVLDWLLGTIPDHSFTFAQVETSSGVSRWDLMDTTIRYRSDEKLFGFKTGAVYEAEAGMRTVLGKRLSAEQYLDHFDSLEAVDICRIPFDIKARVVVEEGNSQSIYKSQDYKWDHSQSSITTTDGVVHVEFTVDDALKVAFLDAVAGRFDLELIPRGGPSVKNGVVMVATTLDLFV